MKIGNWFEMDETPIVLGVCFIVVIWALSLLPGCNPTFEAERLRGVNAAAKDAQEIEARMNAQGFVKAQPGQYVKVEAVKVEAGKPEAEKK